MMTEMEIGGLTGKILLALDLVFTLETLRAAIERGSVVGVKGACGFSFLERVLLLFLRGRGLQCMIGSATGWD